jgi:hypothetical protein
MNADPYGGAGVEAQVRSMHAGGPTVKVRTFIASTAFLAFAPLPRNGTKLSGTSTIRYVAVSSQQVNVV